MMVLNNREGNKMKTSIKIKALVLKLLQAGGRLQSELLDIVDVYESDLYPILEQLLTENIIIFNQINRKYELY